MGKGAIPVLFLALVLWPRASEAFCPHLCSCDDVVMTVTCSGEADLEVIPITLNPMIKRLDLRGNLISTVDASIQFYGQLEILDLSGNRVDDLPDRRFISQKRLVRLALDDNRVENVTGNTFVGLRSLEWLSLRGNQIRDLPEDGAFKELQKVRGRASIVVQPNPFLFVLVMPCGSDVGAWGEENGLSECAVFSPHIVVSVGRSSCVGASKALFPSSFSSFLPPSPRREKDILDISAPEKKRLYVVVLMSAAPYWILHPSPLKQALPKALPSPFMAL